MEIKKLGKRVERRLNLIRSSPHSPFLEDYLQFPRIFSKNIEFLPSGGGRLIKVKSLLRGDESNESP